LSRTKTLDFATPTEKGDWFCRERKEKEEKEEEPQTFADGFVRMEHMKMEMAREIEAMGIKLCCRWVCLLWVTPRKLMGGGVSTTSWWVGSN
jgi:hypothetical protein